MKKIILAATMLLGITAMGFAQTTPAKSTSGKTEKMAIAKANPSKPAMGVSQAAKTSKPAVAKTTTPVKTKTKVEANKTKTKDIGKHKAAKKAKKNQKKVNKGKTPTKQ